MAARSRVVNNNFISSLNATSCVNEIKIEKSRCSLTFFPKSDWKRLKWSGDWTRTEQKEQGDTSNQGTFKVIVIVRRRRFFSFLKQQCYDNVNGCHKKSAFNASRYLSPRSQNVRFSLDYGENSFKAVFLFDLKSPSFPVLLLLFPSPAILRKLIASEYVDAAMQKCSAMTKYKMVMFVFSFVETKPNKL